MRFRDRIAAFMRGRYGFGYGRADRINLALICVYIISGVVNMFVSSLAATYILSFVSLAAVAYLLFRMFSQNVSARMAENEKFSKFLGAFTGFFKYNFRRIKDVGKARYRKCPHCSAKLRLPIKRGKHSVICPKCREKFEVRILF